MQAGYPVSDRIRAKRQHERGFHDHDTAHALPSLGRLPIDDRSSEKSNGLRLEGK